MALAGRKKKLDRPTQWKVYVPWSIASKVDIILMDPATGKAEYGARGELITELLKKWLQDKGVNV